MQLLQRNKKNTNQENNNKNKIFFLFMDHQWRKLGASIALAGYLNQILCPFLVISGLFLTTPSEAMDDDQRYRTTVAASLKPSKKEEELELLKYEDHDIQTAIDLTLAYSTKIERAPGSKYLLKPKNQNHLTFSTPGENPYFVALLPSCSCERRQGTTRVPYFLDTFNQPDVYLEVLSEICERASAQEMQQFISDQEKEKDGADFSKYKTIIERANREDKKFSELKGIFENELENCKRSFKQKNPDVFDELLGQISSLQQASFKIVFPFNTIGHWITGELRGKKIGSTYNFTLYGHDPLGGGNLEKYYKKDQDQIQQCLQERLRLESTDTTLTSSISPYGKRQGDPISCGPIMVDDAFKIILAEDLNIQKPYEFGALTLRENHINFAKTYIKDNLSKETAETEEARFLVRNQERLEKIKALLTDKETKSSPSATSSPEYSLQLMCKPEDIINIKPADLGLFSKGNKLFCKFYNKQEIEINRLDNPTKGFSEWIDKMLSAINRRKVALVQEEAGQQELANFNHNAVSETLKEAGIKELLQYILMQGYSLPKVVKEVPSYSASEKPAPSSAIPHSSPIPAKKTQAFSHEPLSSGTGLTFGHPQQQENKQYKKVASLRPEAAPSLLKIDEYHQQQFGALLNSTLGVNAKPQENVNQSPQVPTQKGMSQLLATFHNEYCQQGVISQSTALDILHLNKYGYGVDQGKSFPSYCFTEIQSTEPFSYGERFSHYAFHSTLFSQGILPVGLGTLKNVCILKEKNLSAYDAQLESKNVSPQFVRRIGQEARILEPTYHSYAVQIQSQPQTQGTLEQLLATDDGLKQISPESLSTLIISHLLTGSKAPLQEYGLLPDESKRMLQLVLPASAHGVYSAITESTVGEQVFHTNHLTSDLFLIPDLMNQPLAKSVADKLTDLIPEIAVLDWLAKLQKSNDFYQRWQNDGSLSFEAFLDAGFPLGVVRGMALHLCSTLYKMQSCLNKGPQPTHEAIFQSLFPALHAAYAYQCKGVRGASSSLPILEATIASKSLEEVLDNHAGPHGRLPDGRYAHDLLRAETAKEAMPLQKITEAAQDLINTINLHKLKYPEKKKALLTIIAKEFLEQGIKGHHESWLDSSFWEELLFEADDPDLLRLVLGRGAKINDPDDAGNYVLHTLLKAPIPLKQLKDCLTVLAKHNDKLDQKDKVKLDQKDKVKLDQKDKEGLTALDIILAPEYPTLERAAALFAHLVKLGASRKADTRPTAKAENYPPVPNDNTITNIQRFNVALSQEEEKQHDLANYNYHIAFGEKTDKDFRSSSTLPQEEKIVEFYHKLRKADLWTKDVQEAFEILQYHHPKLSWALAIAEILPKETESTMTAVLERLRQSLISLKNEEQRAKESEDVDGKKANNLREFKKKITILALDLESLEETQSTPKDFQDLLNGNPYLQEYYQTQIRGVTLGERMLLESVEKQLWNQDGTFKRSNTHGRRDVGKAELNGHVLYFKRYPELPGFEYAMDVLHHQVIGYGTPWSDLLKMRDEPFLVSLGIQGENLHDVLQENPEQDPKILKQLEKKSLQKLILMSMLTNPEDQKPDQFILEKMLGHQDSKGMSLYRLVCVDNDHALAPSVAKIVKENYSLKIMDKDPTLDHLKQLRAGELALYLKGEHDKFYCKIRDKEAFELNNTIGQLDSEAFSRLKQNVANKSRPSKSDQKRMIDFLSSPPFSYLENKMEVRVKSILYCLPQMKEAIGEEVRQLFGSIPFIFNALKKWLKILQEADTVYHNKENPLFEASLAAEFLNRADGTDSFVYGIPFRDNMIHKLCDRWLRLQSILDPNSQKYKKSQNYTPTLAWIFERLEPEIWSRYAESFESNHENNSLLKRFLFVDGQSYKVTNNHFRTTLSTRHFINSLNIPVDPNALEFQRKRGDLFASTIRLEELELAQKNHKLQTEKKADVRNFKSSITGEEKSSFLKHYTFLGKKTAEQQAIIDTLEELKEDQEQAENSPRQLYLQHCSVLTDQTLENIVLTNVTHLNLSGCSNLTGTFLFDVSLHAKHLLYLIMRDLTKIQYLVTHQSQKFEFQKLNLLDISQCPRLESIQLNAPRLQKLRAAECSSLSEIKLSPSPELLSLDLRGDTKVSEADFSAILTQSPKLKEIQLHGCDGIPYAKIIELDPSYPINLIKKCSSKNQPLLFDAIKSILFNNNKTLYLKIKEVDYKVMRRSASPAASPEIDCLLPALTNNTTLTKLKFAWGQISDIDAQKLAFNNNTITKLFLPHNKLGYEDEGIKALAQNSILRELDLWGNYIADKEAQALAANSTLTKLNLGSNEITDIGAQALAANSTLTSLNLGCNKITDIGAQALGANSTLTELNLGTNKIADAGVQLLAANSNLTSLYLGENQFSVAGVQALAANSTLMSLFLNANKIADTGAQVLAHNSTLTALHLDMNKITDIGTQALARNSTLKILDLWDNQITDIGTQALARNSTLKILDLSDNQITDAGVKALSANSTLTSLKLWNNKITDASPFATNTALTSLDLYINEITDASPFAANTTLTELNLGCNKITDIGAQALAANSILTSLHLRNNKITDEGAKDLSTNTTLTSLNLDGNQITDAGVNYFTTNTTLTALNLAANKITDEGHRLIKKMLKRNKKLARQTKPSQLIPLKDEELPTDISVSLPQLPLTGTLQGTSFQFVEKDLTEDNDCGFHGLNLDRSSAIRQLLLSKGNPEIRALVAPEIKAAFIEGNIPLPMRGTWYNHLHQAYHQGTLALALEQELNAYSNDPANYSFFIREHLGGGGSLNRKLGATSTMDALAKLNHLTIHIWQQPTSQGSALKLLCSTESYGKSIIHLLHNSQGAHSKLEAMAVPSAFSKLPFDPQISLFAIKELLPHIHHMDSFIQSLSSKMKEYHDKIKDEEVATVQDQWQQSFDQLKSTLVDTNQALMDTTQDLQTKTSILEAQNVFYTGLSIDGGGVRGLIPAIMLQKLEEKAREYTTGIHIHQMFDYIGGTSVGGILALGLTAPKEEGYKQPLRTLDEMVKLFREEGPIIFQRTFWGGTGGKVINGIAGAALGIFAGPLGMAGGGFVGSQSHDLFKPKFTAEGLEGLLQENFGDLPLSKSLTPIVVTAVNHTKTPLEGFFFDTLMARNHLDHDFLMKDVGRATSAAQTYFSEACIWNLSKPPRSYKFSDGGPFCNNPSNAVYNKIIKKFDHATHKNVRMVSFGTGESKPEYDIPTMQGMKGEGELGWMKPLIYGQMNLSSFWVDFSMRETLGENYIRLQPKIVDQFGNLKEADLADYSPKLLEEYEVLATETFDKYITEDFIRNFMEERADKEDPFSLR